MSDLKYDREKSNLGGISEFKFIYEVQLKQEIDIIKGQARNLVSTSEFIIPDVVINSGKLKEAPKGVNLFEYEYIGYIPRDDYDKLQDTHRLDKNKIIAIIKDNNGESRLLGQKGNACTVTLSVQKGQMVTDRNQYEIKLTWKSKHRAAFANDTYIIPTAYQFEDGNYFFFND